MGEAIMASVGRSGVLPGIKKKLQTRIFTSNGTFVIPGNIVNNEIRVMCYGGGGSTPCSLSNFAGGGGGGWMNQAIFNNIPSQTLININIGPGGTSGGNGGTTFFGNYLSANGGEAGKWYSTTIDRQYFWLSYGGNGGSGGGASAQTSQWSRGSGKGGDGYQFGGGGSGGAKCVIGNNTYSIKTVSTTAWVRNTNQYNTTHYYTLQNMSNGGNGGKYGGGGGGGVFSTSYSGGTLTFEIGSGGKSTGYGGNGGNYTLNGNKGNSITEDRIIKDSNAILYNNPSGGLSKNKYGAGGGGGYGGKGGDANATYRLYNNLRTPYSSDYISYNVMCFSGAGGGGGYGANGGNGGIFTMSYSPSTYTDVGGGGGGGGGGYGGKGADGINIYGGGGGGYGPSNYGAGGGGTAINGNNGKDGICIVQYYEMVME